MKNYQDILDKELRMHGITVYQWSVTSSGNAKHIGKDGRKQIKVPRPTDEDRLHVCFHEIGHILKGHCSWDKNSPRYIQEFDADMFGLTKLTEYGIEIPKDVITRMKWHVLSRLAMAHNRKLNHSGIPPKITQWLNEQSVDLKTWIGNKVFVYWDWRKSLDVEIKMTVDIPKERLSEMLSVHGLELIKSQVDDSTFGNWIIRKKGERFGKECWNLSEVVQYMQRKQILN